MEIFKIKTAHLKFQIYSLFNAKISTSNFSHMIHFKILKMRNYNL